MTRQTIVTAVDIGSSFIHAGCAILEDGVSPRLVGAGTAPSVGVRRGQVVDLDEVIFATSDAFAETERGAGAKLTKSIVVVNGSRSELLRSSGSIAISRADGVVSEDDIERVVKEAQAVSIPKNKSIIHAQPISFMVDDTKDIKDPAGMAGVRLEAEVVLVLTLEPTLKTLEKAVKRTGREAEGWSWGPLATKQAIVSRKEADAGVTVVNIGGATTTISVFREHALYDVKTIPVGGMHITGDIAIGLKTSLDVAERIKIEHGSAVASGVSKREQVVLADWGLDNVNISRYALAQIIEARMVEIFELVEKEIRKYTKERALPGGVVFTGGGAKLKGIVELSKRELKLPSRVGRARKIESELAEAFDPAFSGVVGAILTVVDESEKSSQKAASALEPEGFFLAAKNWLRELLP